MIRRATSKPLNTESKTLGLLGSGAVPFTTNITSSLSTFSVGVFRRGTSYGAVLRFSNSSGSIQHDRKGDGRGLAIKIMLDKDISGREASAHNEMDILLANFPQFFVDSVAEYARFTTIIQRRGSTIVKALLVVAFFVPWRLRKASIFVRLLISKIPDPFAAQYHSMSPYLLGNETVVRYVVTPAEHLDKRVERSGNGFHSSNYLRARMSHEG